jgi:hypothetical protein
MSKKDYFERAIAEQLIIVHYIWAFNVREIITFIYNSPDMESIAARK